MAKRVVVDVAANTTGLQRGLAGAQGKLQTFQQKASRVGSVMTRSVTLPLVGAGVAAFKFASDLAESQNAANIAFGKQAKIVNRWAKNLDSAFGLSQGEAFDMAAQLRLVTKDSKITGEQILTLAERAADVGSVFNVSSKEVGERFRAALVGSSETVQRFGVDTRVTSDGMKRFAKSLGKSVTELTGTEKQLGVLNIIMEQTDIATGDAKNTVDTAAGALRVFKGDAKRAAEDIGQKLIPAGQALIEKVQGIVDWFGNLTDAQQETILKVAAVAIAIGPGAKILGALAGLGRAVSAVILLMTGPLGIVVAIGAIAAAAFVLSRDMNTFGPAFEGKWRNIRVNVINELNQIIAAVNRTIDQIASALGRFIPGAGLLGRINVPSIAVPGRSFIGDPNLVGPPTMSAVRRTGATQGRGSNRQLGGIVPGVPGQPVPIMAHGGEFVSTAAQTRSGGRRGPIIVELVVDGRRIARAIAQPTRNELLRFRQQTPSIGLA